MRRRTGRLARIFRRNQWRILRRFVAGSWIARCLAVGIDIGRRKRLGACANHDLVHGLAAVRPAVKAQTIVCASRELR